MQLKKIVNSLLILIALILASCSDESTDTTYTNTIWIDSYNAVYAHFPIVLYVTPTTDNLVKFIYDDNNRIVRKTGDIIYTSPGSGGAGYLSDSLFTDLDYYDNKVSLTKNISYLGYTVPTHESIVTFNSNNGMNSKTRNFQLFSGVLRKDTTLYTYSNNRLSHFIKTYNKVTGEGYDIRFSEESTIYYTSGNVDSIVTIFSRKYSNAPYTVLEMKEVEIFDGYDSAQNPFKNLQIFEETFNRSLSTNNYSQYKMTKQIYQYPDYDFYQEPFSYPIQEIVTKNWNLLYDITGEWIYN